MNSYKYSLIRYNFFNQELNNIYINEIEDEALLKDVICPQCNILRIPGITISTRIKYTKRKNQTRQRALVSSCLKCNYKIINNKILQEADTGDVKPEPAPINRSTVKQNKLKLEKQKRKKVKLNTKSLLESKKQSSKGSLNLMDFMSN